MSYIEGLVTDLRDNHLKHIAEDMKEMFQWIRIITIGLLTIIAGAVLNHFLGS